MRVLLINPAMNLQKLGRFAGLLEPMPKDLSYDLNSCVVLAQPRPHESPPYSIAPPPRLRGTSGQQDEISTADVSHPLAALPGL